MFKAYTWFKTNEHKKPFVRQMEFQNTLKTLVLFPILKDSLQTGPYAVNIEMFVVNLH